MKTQAVRLHGAGMLSLDEFELPEMREDEILARIVSDSLCMSSYKAAIAGTKHKRVPPDIAERPVIIGHECSGEILAVGKRWEGQYFPGQRFTMQVALNLPDTDYIPGYAYPYLGGDATYVLLPPELMECGCLLPYNGEGFFRASLSEPYSCVIGAFHASYHTEKGRYTHEMGVRVGGDLAILAGAGPMGLAATDYAVHGPRKPARVVVTDIDKARLARAAQILSPEDAKKAGVELIYLDTGETPDAKAALLACTGGKGYDDVFVFTPVASVAELGDAILGRGGCLNFFAGPTDTAFSACVNLYRVHYDGTHYVGTSGGNVEDMREAVELMARGAIHPENLVTHIGGLDCAAETTLALPKLSGGKKLIYTGIRMPLTALSELPALAEKDARFAPLAALVSENRGLWSDEAEKCLLEIMKEA